MDNDSKRAVLGLLTAACNDARQRKIELLDAVMFPDGKWPGIITPYSTSVALPAHMPQQEAWELIQGELERADKYFMNEAHNAIFYMAGLFALLAREAQEHGTDVDGFLERMALDLGSGDSGG